MREFLRAIALDAGKLSLEFRARLAELDVAKKSPKDLVTEADRAVEEFLTTEILKRYPGHGILGEETGERTGGEYRWVIDPIDGTTSFVHEQPAYSVSIAVEKNGDAILAAVNAPVLGELFEAAKGEGARLNGKPVRVSSRSPLENCLLATGFACVRHNRRHNNLPYFEAVMPIIRGIRRLGSAALDLCYVGCGRLDGFWELNLQPYDAAAGLLVVSEAGGTHSDFTGGRANIYGEVVATNGVIHDELIAILSDVREKCLQEGA